MDHASVLGELFENSLGLAVYAWPVSVVILALLSIALASDTSVVATLVKRRWPVIVAVYLLPVLVLFVGAMFQFNWRDNPFWVEPPPWGGLVLYAVLILHAVVVLAVTFLERGIRWRAFAILLPSLWLAISCAFIAAMAIAGVGL